MIDVSADSRAILAGSFTYLVKVSSWLGEQLLAEDVPIADGYEDSDRSLNVPERVTFTVPKIKDGFDWTPTRPDHPLYAGGQTLKVSLGIGAGTDGPEWFQRGEFLIIEAEEDRFQITVTCAGLLTLIDEAEFVSPFQPTGTIASTVRDLIEPALTADLDAAPADRSVPVASVNWDTDRLAALGELLDAWPATAQMNENGYLEVVPAVTPTTAVRSFTDQAGGTIISSAGASSRDGGFNVVVATGYTTDGGEVRGTAYVNSGPWTYGGLANPLPVPFGYASPLLTTTDQCTAAAATIRDRKMREAALEAYSVICVPDPTIQLGDPVTVTTDHVSGLLCTVERLYLPFTPGSSMTLKVVATS